jgi:hypothetical protein
MGSPHLRPAFLLLAANLIDRLVDDLDRMELVEGGLGLRQVLGDFLDEAWLMSMQTEVADSDTGRAHIGSHRNTTGAMGLSRSARRRSVGSPRRPARHLSHNLQKAIYV